MDDDSPARPPSPARLSKTPSWLLLGFVIGILFMWALPRPAKVEPPKPPSKTVILERPKMSDIEAVFAEWERYAVWDRDLTEVALWDVEKRDYSIFYEVLRVGDAFYFRSIPKLTRPILTHGVVLHGCPLIFTETEALRDEWLKRRGNSILPTGMGSGLTTPGDSP